MFWPGLDSEAEGDWKVNAIPPLVQLRLCTSHRSFLDVLYRFDALILLLYMFAPASLRRWLLSLLSSVAFETVRIAAFVVDKWLDGMSRRL